MKPLHPIVQSKSPQLLPITSEMFAGMAFTFNLNVSEVRKLEGSDQYDLDESSWSPYRMPQKPDSLLIAWDRDDHKRPQFFGVYFQNPTGSGPNSWLLLSESTDDPMVLVAILETLAAIA